MTRIRPGDVVSHNDCNFDGAGIVMSVYEDDNEIYASVKYKDGERTYEDSYYVEDLSYYCTVGYLYEAELTCLGEGRGIVRFNAGSDAEAEQWWKGFLNGTETDALDRGPKELLGSKRSLAAIKDNFVTTYTVKVQTR